MGGFILKYPRMEEYLVCHQKPALCPSGYIKEGIEGCGCGCRPAATSSAQDATTNDNDYIIQPSNPLQVADSMGSSFVSNPAPMAPGGLSFDTATTTTTTTTNNNP